MTEKKVPPTSTIGINVEDQSPKYPEVELARYQAVVEIALALRELAGKIDPTTLILSNNTIYGGKKE